MALLYIMSARMGVHLAVARSLGLHLAPLRLFVARSRSKQFRIHQSHYARIGDNSSVTSGLRVSRKRQKKTKKIWKLDKGNYDLSSAVGTLPTARNPEKDDVTKTGKDLRPANSKGTVLKIEKKYEIVQIC